MKFLVLISPIIKFMISKYQANLTLQGIESEILVKFKASELLLPSECKPFIQILSSIRKYLMENNIQYQRESIKKIVGDGSAWKGFLNLLSEQGHEIFIYPYEPGMIHHVSDFFQKIGTDLSDIRVITPLNLDENGEIYTFFHHVLKLPVYPLICDDTTSKWLKDFTFAPNTPRAFYFPEGTCAIDFNDKIIAIAKKEGISHLLLKDEYDFDIRPILPYSLIPIAKADQACRIFYDKIKGIPNYGGLILEEFLANGEAVEVIKTHIFGKLMRSQHVLDRIHLKPFSEGGLYDNFVENIQKQVLDNVTINLDSFDAVVNRYYPYIFASIEYIMYKNMAKIIDVNSVANSLKFEKLLSNETPDFFFKNFIARVIDLKNQEELSKQIAYHETVKKIYKKIRDFGPAFIHGEKVVSLIDDAEKDVKEFLVES